MKCRRLVAGILIAVLCVLMVPVQTFATEIASGTYDNLKWVIDSEGTLTISGTGKFYHFDGIPWADYKSDIVRVVMEEGITGIRDRCFADCVNLVSVSIPDSVVDIEYEAFANCGSLVEIYIPDSVEEIEHNAFEDCDSLTYVRLPKRLYFLGSGAFKNCKNLCDIILPAVLPEIDANTFWGCQSLVKIAIPEGVTKIAEYAFYQCRNLKSITLPSSLNEVGDRAFYGCSKLTDVYYTGTEEQWKRVDIHTGQDIYDTYPYNQPIIGATIHAEIQPSIAYAQLQVYSDVTDLSVEVGETITLSACTQINDETQGDPAGISFQLIDGYAVNVADTGINDGRFYVQLQGVTEGTTYVTFTDSNNGEFVTVPVTVVAENYRTFTINDIPVNQENRLSTNFYNFNGIYVDTFLSYIHADGSADVSFNVYNKNYVYGIVEVYDKDGNLINGVLIDKRTGFNNSLKAIYWDAGGCICQDVYTLIKFKNIDYRQQLNVSKHTLVEVEIPENGYIKITNDPNESNILAIVNSADLLASSLSLIGKAKGYNEADQAFPKALTLDLLEDTAFAHLQKDGTKLFTEVLKGVGKEATISAKTVGTYADTVLKNLKELNLLDTILKNFAAAEVEIAEDVLKDAMGYFGAALEGVFMIGSAENLVHLYDDYRDAIGGGSIVIQNQSGGSRFSQQIKLESEVDFDPEVALQVYSVMLDEELLEKVKNKDAETYELLTKGVTRTYNISLVKNGEETQHSSDVAVYIPIPDDLEYLGLNGHLKVYRIEDDGTLTDMDAVVEGDCIMFTTDHFSLYTLVGYESAETPENPGAPGTDPTQPGDAATKPNQKPTDEPMDEGGNGGVVVIVIVAVVLVLGAAAAIVFARKKK